MKKRIPITYSKERVVLSDILPYETPVTFSNRYFYKYLINRNKYLNGIKKFKGQIHSFVSTHREKLQDLMTRYNIALRYYDELEYEEIARVLDSKVDTLKVNYHYAKEKIKEYILNR